MVDVSKTSPEELQATESPPPAAKPYSPLFSLRKWLAFMLFAWTVIWATNFGNDIVISHFKHENRGKRNAATYFWTFVESGLYVPF